MNKKLVGKLLEEKQQLYNMIARNEFRKMGNAQAVIIDDDPTILNLIEKYLTGVGIKNVRTFEDEYKGLKYIAESLPDIIILDMRLKLTNGLNMAKVLGDMLGVEIPILMISSESWKEEDIICEIPSMRSAFLQKPMDKINFQNKVFSLLDNRRLYKVA